MLKGNRQKNYNYITGRYINYQKMIRKDSLKLIYYPKANIYRFYDLKKDPDELKDLINDEFYKDKIEKYKKLLKNS